MSGGLPDRTLAVQSLAELLDAVAERTSAPGGGAAAGLVAALAAALAAMAARFDGQPADRADQLRAIALALADADVAAYGAFLEARRSGSDAAAALDAATDVPCQLTEVGAEAARLALALVDRGNPRLRGDAAAAVLLAAAAVRTAAVLVCENLAGRDDDPRLGAVRTAVASVTEAERELLARYPL